MFSLKIDSRFFNMQVDGSKRFEIRRNDRGYVVGDYLWLNECIAGAKTGRSVLVEVTCICDYEQKEGFVVLGTSEVLIDSCYTVLS